MASRIPKGLGPMNNNVGSLRFCGLLGYPNDVTLRVRGTRKKVPDGPRSLHKAKISISTVATLHLGLWPTREECSNCRNP